MVIFFIAFLYVFSVFFASRLFIPYLGFEKAPLPDAIPKGMEREILRLKGARSKKEFLQKTYDFLGNRFEGGRFRTFANFGLMFCPIDYLWAKKGFVQCTIHNHFLRIFLVRSGFFRDDEIRLRHTFLNFNIHQYVQVKLNGKWVDVDLSWRKYRIPLGSHASFFR